MLTGHQMKRLALLSIFALLTVICVGAGVYCEFDEKPILPDSSELSELSELGDRLKLRQHIQNIVAQIDRGELLGSTLNEHLVDFEKADEVRAKKYHTVFLFYAVPDVQEEFHWVLYIAVENDSGEIVRWNVEDWDY